MNLEKKQEILTKVSKFGIATKYVKLFEGLCQKCKLHVIQKVQRQKYSSIDPNIFCKDCHPKAIECLKEIKEMIEK